jgi:hypothetical protein
VTFYQHQQRGPKWSQGVDGVWESEKQYEDTDVDVQDWSDYLNGETIASATCATDGISLTSSSSTSTTTTATVTGIGALHWDITTSAGRVFRTYFRWRRLNRPILGSLGGGQSLPGEDYR